MKTHRNSGPWLVTGLSLLLVLGSAAFKPAPAPVNATSAVADVAGISLRNSTTCSYSVICTWGTSCADTHPCVNCFVVPASTTITISTCGGAVLHSLKVCCDASCMNQSGVCWSGCGGTCTTSGSCNGCNFRLGGDATNGFLIF